VRVKDYIQSMRLDAASNNNDQHKKGAVRVDVQKILPKQQPSTSQL
jgi:hypothetical protein